MRRSPSPAYPLPPSGGPSGDSTRSTGADWIRNSKLAVACLALFTVCWFAQSITGWNASNADARRHGQGTVGYAEYLTTGHFAEATFENWESEFLQMGAFVLLTIFLVQKGSAESKRGKDDPEDADPHAHRADPDTPWPVRRGGLVLKLYENSLLIAFTILFLGSIVGHAFGGAAEANDELEAHGEAPVSVREFASTSQFWFESFQNWQSEFLAVGSIVVLTIFLRQRGSPESKPVHAPTEETG